MSPRRRQRVGLTISRQLERLYFSTLTTMGSRNAARARTLRRDRALSPVSGCRFMPAPGATCRSPGSRPANAPPTDDQKARPPCLAIRPLTWTYVVAGAGFEPATSGL